MSPVFDTGQVLERVTNRHIDKFESDWGLQSQNTIQSCFTRRIDEPSAVRLPRHNVCGCVCVCSPRMNWKSFTCLPLCLATCRTLEHAWIVKSNTSGYLAVHASPRPQGWQLRDALELKKVFFFTKRSRRQARKKELGLLYFDLFRFDGVTFVNQLQCNIIWALLYDRPDKDVKSPM